MQIDRIIRLPEVLEITGVSKSCIHRWCRDGLFPRPVRLGPNSTGWPSSEIKKWLDSLEPVGGPASPDEGEQQEGVPGGDASPREAAS